MIQKENNIKENFGTKKITELEGELGEKMISHIKKLSPTYAKFIKNSVAAMNSDSIFSRRNREMIRLSSLITVRA